ncbi:hypothetical protein [Clostridium intestinale]|uniref:Uncharacterized protein n=1 Tax=Clostridium intestinale DSM 6191 TaxID=1121320 RepID=A0A1M5WPX1_9CLOT|nr:hypothetical protein [Clostridium intestinale]SHH89655.1 hypothetical protein SAMN02745941_01199 [Clostridium intestinale DSM 6191]
MVEMGCLARFNNPYEEEVEFAKKNNFKLMQVWYDRGGIINQKIIGWIKLLAMVFLQ